MFTLLYQSKISHLKLYNSFVWGIHSWEIRSVVILDYTVKMTYLLVWFSNLINWLTFHWMGRLLVSDNFLKLELFFSGTFCVPLKKKVWNNMRNMSKYRIFFCRFKLKHWEQAVTEAMLLGSSDSDVCRMEGSDKQKWSSCHLPWIPQWV